MGSRKLLKASATTFKPIDAVAHSNYSQQSGENLLYHKNMHNQVCFGASLLLSSKISRNSRKPESMAVIHSQGIVAMFTFKFTSRLDDFES